MMRSYSALAWYPLLLLWWLVLVCLWYPLLLLWRGLHSFWFWLVGLVGVIGLLIAYYVVADRETPLTTDAYVQAYVVQVAPQVAGQVTRVYVAEGDEIQKGALLFELDSRPFEHQVALLEAKQVEAEQQVKQLQTQLQAAEAEHERLTAEGEYARVVHDQEKAIFQQDSTTQRKYLDSLYKYQASQAALRKSARGVQHTREGLDARIGKEHTLVAQVRAQLAEARLNLGYTRVFAPCSGVITNLQLREGAYAHVGQALLTCIDTSQWLIVAQLREKALERMRPGQPALVALQGVPGRLWPARVQYVGWGVSQGQGVPSGLLPDVKNQTSWIPASQRFQVRVVLDDPGAVALRVGMTGSVSVYVEPEGRLNGVTKAIHQIIAWFYYL
jgi:multidrug resistance efflux pump